VAWGYNKHMQKNKIYCAGPFFSPEDRFQVEEIASTLKSHDFSVYCPHEHALYKHYMAYLKSGREKKDILSRAIFACNLYHLIELCQGVVFSLNGRVPDEGGNITSAIAFIVGKPVVLYKKDVRAKLAGDDNAMITGLGDRFKNITRLEEIPKTLSRAMAEKENKSHSYRLPLNVQSAVEYGRDVQEFLSEKQADLMDEKVAEKIIEMCEKSEWYKKFII